MSQHVVGPARGGGKGSFFIMIFKSYCNLKRERERERYIYIYTFFVKKKYKGRIEGGKGGGPAPLASRKSQLTNLEATIHIL